MSYSVEDVREIISKMDIVESTETPGLLKQAREDIYISNFGDDEFTKHFVANLPNFYLYLKKIVNGKSEDVLEDAKEFLNHFESMAKEQLSTSDFVNLLKKE